MECMPIQRWENQEGGGDVVVEGMAGIEEVEGDHDLAVDEWDDSLIGYYELQYSPISYGDSNVWNAPLESEQVDDFGNPKWDIQDEFFGEETRHSLPPDVNS
ncbi:hypothetical protein LWI29_035763 [Acer saccharum]|uniref:Uncharacterized protein n=1 Tax=Acer saccharum TaxID=4024 RepID=A0AA39SA13_ACESA|nr:hypothetical protein LWI29_035763 [Acer saccharum]